MQAMLKLYAERAGVTAGKPLRILDMGCGWGSVSLWFAEHFPEATVRGISNSNSQVHPRHSSLEVVHVFVVLGLGNWRNGRWR